jgi:quercetin dioxygenase-like cupin family protein
MSMASRFQDEVVGDPGIAKVEFENDEVRVLRTSYAPHQKSHMHSHPSRIIVPLTSNEARVTFADGKLQDIKRRPGEVTWSEPVTHMVENLTDEPQMNIELELKKQKGRGQTVQPVSATTAALGTESDPVPVEGEPHHRVIFENQYVRVLEVVVKPGELTLFHKHSLDNVAVTLSGTTVGNQIPGGEWTQRVARDGSVGFAAGTTKPYVHRINNAGTKAFHVLDIQILP